MYIGNPGICGPLLPINSFTNEINQYVHQGQEAKLDHNQSDFYLSMNTGFVMGLWTMFWAILFKKTWRTAYFELFDQFYDRACVIINEVAFMRKTSNHEGFPPLLKH